MPHGAAPAFMVWIVVAQPATTMAVATFAPLPPPLQQGGAWGCCPSAFYAEQLHYCK